MSSTALTQKRRRSSWISSYSELSISDAEERLGFEMESLGKNPIAITELVATANNRVGGATINSMKEKVYSNILDYLGFCHGAWRSSLGKKPRGHGTRTVQYLTSTYKDVQGG